MNDNMLRDLALDVARRVTLGLALPSGSCVSLTFLHIPDL